MLRGERVSGLNFGSNLETEIVQVQRRGQVLMDAAIVMRRGASEDAYHQSSQCHHWSLAK